MIYQLQVFYSRYFMRGIYQHHANHAKSNDIVPITV